MLRAVAGLVRPERGRVVLDGEVLFDAEAGVDVPPEDRRVGFVFQDYALFPHMTVAQNVAYGSRNGTGSCSSGSGSPTSRGAARRALGRRASARRARAGAGARPGVLLLDEPLSALDPHTRAALRLELKELSTSSTCPSCS